MQDVPIPDCSEGIMSLRCKHDSPNGHSFMNLSTLNSNSTVCNAPSTIYCDRSTATNSLNPTVICLLGIGLRFGIGLSVSFNLSNHNLSDDTISCASLPSFVLHVRVNLKNREWSFPSFLKLI
eukprot:scaffold8204_cov177-Amphora_coffeaeformis.AAC.4